MATVLSNEQVEKCGYLKIKRPPSSGKVRLKAWQSKYFVLRGSPPLFEYFKDELSYHMTRGHKEVNRISLENVIHIGTTDASKTQRNAFMIVSPHGALMLASDNEQDAKEWVEVLKRVALKPGTPQEYPPDLSRLVYPEQSPPVPRRSVPNVASVGSPKLGADAVLRRASDPPVRESSNQGFLVTTRLTPSSEKNGIRDKYKMYVTDKHVVLHRLDSNNPFISWPLVDLRGWKCESAETAGQHGMQLLTLESGRKSATGVGLFQFFTNSGDEIAAKIRAHSNVLWESAVKKREKFKFDRSNSFEDLDHPSSPPGETIKKALTEPQPQKPTAPQCNLASRSESDSLLNFDKIERPKLSPNSLRKTLLQGMCEKDTIETKEFEPLVQENVESILAQPMDNAYLDLINESGVEPVHISDPEHRRTSTNSEDLAPLGKSQIASISESDEQADYVDERELNTSGSHVQENSSKSVRGVASQSEDSAPYSDAAPTVIPSETSAKTTKQVPSTPDTQFCQDFFEQLSNPTAHKASIFPQHQAQQKLVNQELVKSENIQTVRDLNGKQGHRVVSETTKKSVTSQDVFSSNIVNVPSNKGFESTEPESSSREDILSPNDIVISSGSVEQERRGKENLHSLLKRSDETQDLLQKCLFQLESPQTFAKQDLFPTFPKRNSTGTVTSDRTTVKKVNDGKLQMKSLTLTSELSGKKIIEKSKSHSGFESKVPSDKPPPLPARREINNQGRSRTNSASMGDIFEGVQRRSEQFPKGINRQHAPMVSHTTLFGASCGPESLVSARLLERTTSGSNLIFEKRSTTHLSIQGPVQSEGKLSMIEAQRPRSSSLRSSGHSSQSWEDDKNTDNEGEPSKRRGSKASKFLNKVLTNFSLAPVVSTKRRASCDCLAPDATGELETRARSSSAFNPGIDNEGWSPETSLDVPTPEGSPKQFRKSSSALRRASHDPSLGRKSFFIGSPTFDNREEMKERARERERERADFPNQPPPALPPRKKSDPPPLPPRRRKSSGDHGDQSCPSSPPSRTGSTDHPQSSAIKATSFKGPGTRTTSSHDESASPPPIPPRREERRGSQPPAIQLTASSPENKNLDSSLDGLPEEPVASTSVEGATKAGKDSSEMAGEGPPTISSSLSKATDVSCPVPKRPPKTKGQWTQQQPIDLLDSAFPDKEISGPRHLILERKRVETFQESCEETMRPEKTDSAFISIGIQERTHEIYVHDRLEVTDIELDSMTHGIQSDSREIRQTSNIVPPRSDMTDRLSPPIHQAASKDRGTHGRCSPGHSPTQTLNMPNRGSGLVLADAGQSTTPISV